MDILFKKEWWEVIVIFLFFGGVLSGIAYFIMEAIRKSKLKVQKTLGGFSLSTDGEDFKSPHATCPHSKDIILLLRFQYEIVHKKDSIEMIEIMREQMKYTEDHLGQLKLNLKKDYLANLKMFTTNIGVNFSSKEYKHYAVINDLIEEKTLPMFRKIYRENHFASRSEIDFQAYKREKTELLFGMWMELYNELSLPSGSESSVDYQQALRSSVTEVFSDCIIQARKIALEKKAEIADLDEQLENMIQKYLGY
jgi:hypothetical protein